MDREQNDMQFLRRFGIYLESCKIIFNFRRIVSKISLAFILPLSLIFIANIAVSDSLEGAAFWLVEFVFLTFLLVFFVLSTSAVVYTVAGVYTGYDVTFGKVMSVIPKVWKRLMVTFLCAFLANFLCSVVFVVPIILWTTIMHVDIDGSVFCYAILILYVVGIVYMTVVWRMAGVVSVLEDMEGIKAMTKSRNLIQGKMWIAIVTLLKLEAAIYGIYILFESHVVHNGSISVAGKLAFGFLCLLMLFGVFLFGLVTETVIYFVCKSYHHESVNQLSLLHHLDEVYQGEYIPTKANDDQLELEKIDV